MIKRPFVNQIDKILSDLCPHTQTERSKWNMTNQKDLGLRTRTKSRAPKLYFTIAPNDVMLSPRLR